LANTPYNFVSIRDYGVVGDGVADVTVAINAAIDDVLERFNATKGDKVVDDATVIYFPPGEYRLMSPVVRILDDASGFNLGLKLTIKGAGFDLTRFIVDNNTGGFNFTHNRHEGYIEFSDLAVVTKPANKSVSGVLRNPTYGIKLECLDSNFSTQDRMAVLKNLRLGWDEERGSDWQIGHPNENGYMQKGITLLNYYIPLIENITMVSRKQQSNQNSLPAEDADSWGICVDNCYGGVITACNLNINHHKFGIKDRWYRNDKEPKGEGGHVSDCNIQARIGFSRRRWQLKPHLSMYSNHFNTSEKSVDLCNVTEAIINDTVIINDGFATSNYGFNLDNVQRCFIDQVTYSYGQAVDYTANRAFNITGNFTSGVTTAHPTKQVRISNYSTYTNVSASPPAGFANIWDGCESIEVREDHWFEDNYPGSQSYPSYWILNGSASGFYISRT